jgi:hypothetical protein
MPDITVQRHGDRWAVFEAGAESPTQEHETREAAEQSARALAAGGEVHVREDDPSGLQEAPEVTEGSDSPKGTAPIDRVPRSIQAGL